MASSMLLPARQSILSSIRSALTLPAIVIPLSITLNIPTLLPGIFESILRAVPKKKTSHSKKRMRQLAGKALTNLTNLNKCPGCGRIKRAHTMCEFCVESLRSLWKQKPEDPEGNEATKESKVQTIPYSPCHRGRHVSTVRTYRSCNNALLLPAHSSDVYALAVTPKYVLSASGESSVKAWDGPNAEHPLVHEFKGAHRLGVHHLGTDRGGTIAASVGFEGGLKLWDMQEMKRSVALEQSANDIWAVALSHGGERCTTTTHDGRIVTRDVRDIKNIASEYNTKGSFGLCVDVSADGRYTVSGHANGGIYVFNNESGRMIHSLSGLVKPIRAISFSPGGRLVAAAGESNVIALYDASSGEQIASLTGHNSWIFSLDWSETGQYLLSGSFDGKAKVWSIDQKTCVATHSESDQGLYAVRWLPKGVNEGFVTGGANHNIVFYREATGS